MSIARRKASVLLLGMVGAAALAHIGVPNKRLADSRKTELEAMFPKAFGEWVVDSTIPVILPSPDVQAKLDELYNQVLARTYVHRATGARIMLSVAYGGDQSDGTNAHLPEVCYPAQGFQLMAADRTVLSLNGRRVPVRRLTTRLGTRLEPVTYWLTIGDRVSTSTLGRKLDQMRYGLRGTVPDGMLVRVSGIDKDAEGAFAMQRLFLEELAISVPGQYRDRLFGTEPASASAAADLGRSW